MDTELLTIAEATKVLGVTHQRVHSLIKSGRLGLHFAESSENFGPRIIRMVSKAEVDSIVERRAKQPVPA